MTSKRTFLIVDQNEPIVALVGDGAFIGVESRFLPYFALCESRLEFHRRSLHTARTKEALHQNVCTEVDAIRAGIRAAESSQEFQPSARTGPCFSRHSQWCSRDRVFSQWRHHPRSAPDRQFSESHRHRRPGFHRSPAHFQGPRQDLPSPRDPRRCPRGRLLRRFVGGFAACPL